MNETNDLYEILQVHTAAELEVIGEFRISRSFRSVGEIEIGRESSRTPIYRRELLETEGVSLRQPTVFLIATKFFPSTIQRLRFFF